MLCVMYVEESLGGNSAHAVFLYIRSSRLHIRAKEEEEEEEMKELDYIALTTMIYRWILFSFFL